MPYVVINTSNDFEPTKGVRYASIDEADAVARDILSRAPGAIVYTAQVITDYRGRVDITASVPEEVEPLPENEEEQLAE